ncbi:MAG: stage II sporulation protein D [Clostridiales bacterium]|nr:stage II sporulation protein D [Clostridiales bacterium]
MKRIALTVLILYVVLMLIPLPALKLKSGDAPVPAPTEPAASGTGETSPPSAGEDDAGIFRLYDAANDTVNEIAVRDFLIGTVAAELPVTFHIEAIKAQAVASYTYYSVQRSKSRAAPDDAIKGADFADELWGYPIYYSADSLREKWGDNYDANYGKFAEAVDAVLGKTITYSGEPILAVYHAISPGQTESAETMWGSALPYLIPVPSPGDKLSPDYQSEAVITPEEFAAALKESNAELTLDGDPSVWIGADPACSASGTVTQITVGGQTMKGSDLRSALGLRSSCFTVGFSDGAFHFTVLGYGHGVGMSQYGADYLARQGSSYEEILHYYYSGVDIA